jgi:hypothetical protein
LPWDTSKPATGDAANTIGTTTPANFSALDTWASGLTDGVSAGASAIFKMYRAANAVVAKFRAAAGDTFDRFTHDLNGQLEWGSGAAATDVVLSRSEANVLRLASGDAIRSQSDPAHAEDLVRRSFLDNFLHVQDEKSNTTAGGTFTSGAFRTRDLNTVKTNGITGASLAANQITLPAGTYYIDAHAPAAVVDSHQVKLRNTTDAADTLIGTIERARTTDSNVTRSFVSGRFTIASSKVFELQHRAEVTNPDDGFGIPSSGFGVFELYSVVKIWKVG